MQPLFRDVSDHIRRVQEEIESLREVLAFAFETSLMTGQAQQTEITRKLAAWAAILAVPTAVAGVYGMNFEHMPELHWQYGYVLVLAVIASVCGWLYWRYCQLDARSAQLPQVQPSSQSKSAYEGSPGRIAPGIESAIAGHAILTGGKTMTAELEVVVDRSVNREKLLGMPG